MNRQCLIPSILFKPVDMYGAGSTQCVVCRDRREYRERCVSSASNFDCALARPIDHKLEFETASGWFSVNTWRSLVTHRSRLDN